jgi:hypothetical protein
MMSVKNRLIAIAAISLLKNTMNTKSTMLFALLLGLSLQTQAQDARLHALRPEATATPEELQAMQPHKAAETEAIGGGLECKDAFIDVNIALGQRITRNVFCPAGTVAVSGGATATFNTGLYINATGPTSGTDIDPNKWFTSVENFSGASGIGPSVRFYARCCRALP